MLIIPYAVQNDICCDVSGIPEHTGADVQICYPYPVEAILTEDLPCIRSRTLENDCEKASQAPRANERSSTQRYSSMHADRCNLPKKHENGKFRDCEGYDVQYVCGIACLNPG